MGGNRLERLAPLEVVAEFLGVRLGILAIHDFGGNGGLLFVRFSNNTAQAGVVGDALGDDVAGACKGVGGGGDFLFGVDEFGGLVRRIGVLIFQQPIGESSQAAFDCFGGPCLAFGAVGGEDVLNGGKGGGGFEFFPQLGGEERAFFK